MLSYNLAKNNTEVGHTKRDISTPIPFKSVIEEHKKVMGRNMMACKNYVLQFEFDRSKTASRLYFKLNSIYIHWNASKLWEPLDKW